VSIEVALTQPELAALAGATEPTVQRVLSTLREQGVVQTGYRRLSVLDEVGLARLART
jgi:DNA-binding IclR family transcriptional regulator